jgi:hypothetical protein
LGSRPRALRYVLRASSHLDARKSSLPSCCIASASFECCTFSTIGSSHVARGSEPNQMSRRVASGQPNLRHSKAVNLKFQLRATQRTCREPDDVLQWPWRTNFATNQVSQANPREPVVEKVQYACVGQRSGSTGLIEMVCLSLHMTRSHASFLSRTCSYSTASYMLCDPLLVYYM